MLWSGWTANTGTPPPGPALPRTAQRLANLWQVASLLPPALLFHLSCVPPVSRFKPIFNGTFSQQRLPGSKGSEHRMRSPSPSLPFSPLSPGPCSELSDPLSLPGREEGEDKFIPVPEQKALCAQTQQGMRIRGAPGIRKALESSKSFGAREPRGLVSWTRHWAGCLGNCSAEDPHGIQRSHLGISLGLSFPLHSERCA